MPIIVMSLIFGFWVIGVVILFKAQKLADRRKKMIFRIIGLIFLLLPFLCRLISIGP